MLGKVGSLQNIPAPSVSVLNEALKLLSTFGDSKGLSKLLEQVLEVQQQNQKVFTDAQSALAAIRTAQTELEQDARKHAARVAEENADLLRRVDGVRNAEAKLDARITSSNNDQREIGDQLAEVAKSLGQREQALQKREAACADKEAGLAELAEELGRAEANLKERKEQLQAKERKLRAALDGNA